MFLGCNTVVPEKIIYVFQLFGRCDNSSFSAFPFSGSYNSQWNCADASSLISPTKVNIFPPATLINVMKQKYTSSEELICQNSVTIH